MILSRLASISLFTFAALVCSFAWPDAAQGVEVQDDKAFSKLRRQFETAFRGSDVKRRRKAAREMQAARQGKAIDVMQNAIDKILKTIRKLEKDTDRLDKKIKEEIYERVEKPRMTPAKRQEARKLVESQLEPDKRSLAKKRKRLEDERALVGLVRESIGVVASELDEDERANASTFLGRLLNRAKTKAREQIEVIRSLASVDHPQAVAGLAQSVHLSPFPSARVAALNALAAHVGEASESAVVSALADDYWQVRIAALEALRKVGGKACFLPLVDRLEKDKGRVREEVVKTLFELTGANFHDNATLWKRWWSEWSDSFEGRGATAVVAGWKREKPAGSNRNAAQNAEGADFYGIRTEAKSIIYILDISGSMLAALGHRPGPNTGRQPQAAPVGKKGERKIDKAVKEMLRSIDGLPKDGTFNIVFYHSDVFLWKKKMQKATRKAKQEARSWAEAVAANGFTNIFDALAKAFEITGRGSFDKHYEVAAETIFLLSDGSANRGRYTTGPDMLRGVRELNKLSKIQINTIALGASASRRFLQRLAEQNGGEFALVQ